MAQHRFLGVARRMDAQLIPPSLIFVFFQRQPKLVLEQGLGIPSNFTKALKRIGQSRLQESTLAAHKTDRRAILLLFSYN
jgi:hypothetical protein